MNESAGDSAIAKVRAALDAAGGSDLEIRVVEGSIFTVDDAAATIGVPPEEILKSLILLVDKKPCLVLMCGPNRVDSKAAALALGGKRSRMMPPEEVFERYGFRVGGVPPIGYPEQLPTVIDEDMFKHEIVWAAAGTDHAFFPVTPERIMALTGGIKAAVKKTENADEAAAPKP